MDRQKLISRLVDRKLAAGIAARGCEPCFGGAPHPDSRKPQAKQ
jgi:hypothetical protein